MPWYFPWFILWLGSLRYLARLLAFLGATINPRLLAADRVRLRLGRQVNTPYPKTITYTGLRSRDRKHAVF